MAELERMQHPAGVTDEPEEQQAEGAISASDRDSQQEQDPAAEVPQEASRARTEPATELSQAEEAHDLELPRDSEEASESGSEPPASNEPGLWAETAATESGPEPSVLQTVSSEDLFGEPEDTQAPSSDEDTQLKAVLEAIIYVTEDPLPKEQIAAALQQPLDRVRRLLEELSAQYDSAGHGICIREVAGGYKMATKPEHHESVRTFAKSLKPPLKLSLAALETLAVIAYKQPVTAPEVGEIRGVQGTGVLKTLLDRKLITTAGRKNVIGKPILYKTTKEFLVQFGLKDLAELPSLKEFEEIRRMALADTDTPSLPEEPAAATSQATAHPEEAAAEEMPMEAQEPAEPGIPDEPIPLPPEPPEEPAPPAPVVTGQIHDRDDTNG